MSTLEIDITGGGDPGPEGHAAIAAAIRRTFGARSSERRTKPSAWARAGRLEAMSDVHIRAKAQLEGLRGR